MRAKIANPLQIALCTSVALALLSEASARTRTSAAHADAVRLNRHGGQDGTTVGGHTRSVKGALSRSAEKWAGDEVRASTSSKSTDRVDAELARRVEAVHQTRLALLRAAIAVQLDGLDALQANAHRDPYGAGPLTYAKTDNGFTLRSTLIDRKDKPVELTVGR